MTRTAVVLAVALVAVVSSQAQHQHFQVQGHRGASQGRQNQQFQNRNPSNPFQNQNSISQQNNGFNNQQNNRFNNQQSSRFNQQQNSFQNRIPQQPQQLRTTTRRTTTTTSTTTTAKPQQQGTLLTLPELEFCKNRPKQWKFGNHWYYFSWDEENKVNGKYRAKTEKAVAGKKVNWLEARNECRKACMDAVSIESYQENQMVFDFVKQGNITYIWTSGRLCDFTGCEERKDLQPIDVLGWFWSGTNTKILATNKNHTSWPVGPWSYTGHNKRAQPDNAEQAINGRRESCLGVLNNLYDDGIKWHDIACYHPKPFICEDSDALLEYVRATSGDQFE